MRTQTRRSTRVSLAEELQRSRREKGLRRVKRDRDVSLSCDRRAFPARDRSLENCAPWLEIGVTGPS